MREIKFRGKSKDNFGNVKVNDWIIGGIVFDDERVWIDIPYYGQIIVDEETVGQYVGLKDKNGKEIYEGDIVSANQAKGQIKWLNNKGKYVIVFPFGDYAEIAELGDNIEILEVVGNIYDNPELLEEE